MRKSWKSTMPIYTLLLDHGRNEGTHGTGVYVHSPSRETKGVHLNMKELMLNSSTDMPRNLATRCIRNCLTISVLLCHHECFAVRAPLNQAIKQAFSAASFDPRSKVVAIKKARRSRLS